MITRIRSQVVCLAAICLFAPATHASVITFNATGETANDSTLSGTVTIDTVAGTVTAVDLTMSGTFSFTENILSYAIPFDGQFVILADDVPSTPPWVDLFLPVTTLVGYGGGDFCSGACPINSEAAVVAGADNLFTSGSLTAAASAPEPTSLALVGAAMLGLAAWRIRQRATRDFQGEQNV